MKANELMCGDWVEFNSTNHQVLEIYEYDIEGKLYLDNDEIVHISKIKPIPLTKEILKNNGFELYGNEWQYHSVDDKEHVFIEFSEDNKVYISVYNELTPKDNKGRADLVSFHRDWCSVFYVHQLQHAMNDCEINKKINVK